jgi:hypothetical protein
MSQLRRAQSRGSRADNLDVCFRRLTAATVYLTNMGGHDNLFSPWLGPCVFGVLA